MMQIIHEVAHVLFMFCAGLLFGLVMGQRGASFKATVISGGIFVALLNFIFVVVG